MSNELMTVDYNPNVLAELIKLFPELAEANNSAMSGIHTGHPSIGLNGTRFVLRENGEEKTLPTLELNVAIIAAKEALQKTWYATKFTPGQEPQSPDCKSSNGLTPDADSKLKQADNCAGCKWNQFGTSTNQDGLPGKSKACTDAKQIVVFFNGAPLLFKIPPASLNNFGSYVKSLSLRGIPMPCCVTTIGFDPAVSYPALTFNFAGMLSPEQIKIVLEASKSPTVLAMIGKKVTALPASVEPVKAPVQEKVKPVTTPKPQIVTPVVEVVQETKTVAPPVEVVVESKPVEAVPQTTSVSDSDAALIAALGL